MTRQCAYLLATVVASQLSGCSSSRDISTTQNYFRTDLGRVTTPVMVKEVPLILNRYQFVLFRNEDRRTTWYFETEWKLRDPFEDEYELGFVQAHTQIIIEARRSGAQWRADFRVYNRYQRAVGVEWEEGPVTPMFREYAQRIAREMSTEFATATN